MPPPRLPSGRTGALLVAVLAVLVAGVVSALVMGGSPSAVRTRVQRLAATPEPGGAPVQLDTTLYVPSRIPAPAVLLAHGFGGSKAELDASARTLARHGYVVLAYTARGFGRSGGRIHLDSLDYEVPDARRLVDWLATRPEVAKRDGSPRVAVAGSSYGGVLALMLAGTDPRIQAVVADITWHDLGHALFPNGATGPGVFKRLWAGYLFQAGAAPRSDPSCGRYAPEVCAAYQRAASTGQADAQLLALLRLSSPGAVAGRITAPVLLSQGEQDSLFPLSEADANARAIAARGTPVRVVWRSGGHDGGGSLPDATVLHWLDDAFGGRVHGQQPFRLAAAGSSVSTANRQAQEQQVVVGSYPGPVRRTELALGGETAQVAAPAGGVPAAITSGPGLGALAGAASLTGGLPGVGAVPGQVARACTARLSRRLLQVGGGTVSLTVSGHSDATLFVSLHDVAGPGEDTLPAGLVMPIRVQPPGQVQVQLPWVVHAYAEGHRVCAEVSTTDLGYALPSDARTYTVRLSGPLLLSTLDARPAGSGHPLAWLGAGVLAALLATAFVSLTRPRAVRGIPQDRDVPIVVDHLVKEYGDGYRAVDDLSFEVRAGQVVGLLGPNGAGKTTALRVLVGLIQPTEGEVRVFGQPMRPGSPVLHHVGTFIEGPGFLPHLSGRDNLRLYWAATGRPEADAHLDIALEIAGLGTSVERRVKTYSHGMQQRLGIAQAMLGLPEVLVLDEPTNGLDPPQIAEMREVLHAYASTGRTVVVSSHLLAEVEQTCTHVVVMNRGRLVAAGSVTDVAGSGRVALAVPDPDAATAVLAAAGIEARLVPARRALEDVFLALVDEDEGASR